MKRFYLTLVIFALVLFGCKVAYSQTGEPPGLDLPIDDETVTATATATAEESVEVEASATVSAEESVATQEAIDDAETGAEIILLVILSIIGGLGLLLIKKYFDSKKFSI